LPLTYLFVDHAAARAHAVGILEQQHLPVRQPGIGDRAHQHPMIGRLDGEHLLDQPIGALGVGAEHAGDEADIGAAAFRILEGLHLAQAAHQHRQRVGLGLAAIGVDPLEHRIGRTECAAGRCRRGGRRGGGGCERKEYQNGAGAPPPGSLPGKLHADRSVSGQQIFGRHGALPHRGVMRKSQQGSSFPETAG
jgi:hypothetical protein